MSARTILFIGLALAISPGHGAKGEEPSAPSVAAPLPARTGAVVTVQPLTLEEAVARALRLSPRMERARRERLADRAKAERERPRRGAGLNVDAEASGTLRGPKLTFPARDEEAVVDPRRRFRLELRAEQVLFQAGRHLAAERAAAAEAQADLELRRVEEELALSVVRAYFGALTARAAAETARRGAVQAQEARRRVEQLLAVGRATPGERLQAEAEEAEAQRAARAAERGIQLADAALNRLLARPLTQAAELVAPADLPSRLPPQQEAVAAALRERADVELLRRQVRAAEAAAELAQLSRRPTIIASVGYALQTPSAFVARSSWSAGVAVTFPIWDGDRARLQSAEARERAASARSALEELEGGVALQVLQARFGVIDAQERIDTTRRAVEAAAELLRATEQRLGLGRATALELVTARAVLRRAEAEAARARYDLHLAWAEFDFAVGKRATDLGRR